MRSVTAMRRECACCAKCRRTPVPGEFVHRLQSGRVVCSLCLVRVPEPERSGAVADRVHASERPLAVAPRAA